MCILCEIKKKAAAEAESNESQATLTLSEVAHHAREIIGEGRIHPIKALNAIGALLPFMKDPDAVLRLLVQADDEVKASQQPRSGGIPEDITALIEKLEKENARLSSQVNLQHTNGKAMGDALAALSMGVSLELPVLDGTNPRETVKALALVADTLETHKKGIEFWMREITNRYDLNKSND